MPLLPEELLEIIFQHLVSTHVTAFCRCRAVSRWHRRCANQPQWNHAALRKIYDEGLLTWCFTIPAEPCVYPLTSNYLVAGQTRCGPLKWRIFLYPKGNHADGWMSAYVEPLQLSMLGNSIVTLNFHQDSNANFMTSTVQFTKMRPDWGLQTWQRTRHTDSIVHISISVKIA